MTGFVRTFSPTRNDAGLSPRASSECPISRSCGRQCGSMPAASSMASPPSGFRLEAFAPLAEGEAGDLFQRLAITFETRRRQWSDLND